MADRDKAVSYLAEGHALLRAHGLYRASGDEHFFAIDRALANFEGAGLCAPSDIESAGLIDGAGLPPETNGLAEAAAALQALYEAKRLVTARASIEGRRIILSDWFLSLAVGLALPLRKPGLTALVSSELRRIGHDANQPSLNVSKKAFCATIDRFTDALAADLAVDHAADPVVDHAKSRTAGLAADLTVSHTAGHAAEPPRGLFQRPASAEPDRAHIGAASDNKLLSAGDNKLLSALDNGCFRVASAEVRHCLAQMEDLFAAKYAADTANEMDGWIYGALMSGGKRLRPILVRLCAGVAAQSANNEGSVDTDSIISIMSTIELIHNASLVHDDIVDRSPLRRSRATINAAKGDGYAAMCGFKMIADALELCGDGVSGKLTAIIAEIPMRMCGGELSQFDIENKPELQSESEYYRRIGCKTAALIEGACVCGAALGGASDELTGALADYGRALGLLFQLRDDLLDYDADAKSSVRAPTNPVGLGGNGSGKPVSQDMERGVYSLPLLYAREKLADADLAEAAKLDSIMRKHIKSPADFRYLNEIAESSGGMKYTREAMESHAGAALAVPSLLPPGPYAEALALLVGALSDSAAAQKVMPAADSLKIVRLNRD